MKKGLIFTDLDGTLLFHEKQENGERIQYIKPEDLAALKKLRESGHIIVIATGRELIGIRRFLRESFVAFDYYVGSNGSLILDEHFREIERTYLPKDVLVELIRFIEQSYPQMEMMGTDGENMSFFGKKYTNSQVETGEKEAIITNFTEFQQNDANFIMMNAHPSAEVKVDREAFIVELEQKANALFGDRINMFHNQDFLDFVPLNVSKGNAVEKLAAKLDIPLENVYVIGDSWNDVSMFETDANSFSFFHADDAIQKKVQNIVHTFADMVSQIEKKSKSRNAREKQK